MGVHVRKVSLNPSILTPFLDGKNAKEAALKNFLRSMSEVSIFNLPNQQVFDDIVLRADDAKYARRLDLTQGEYRMLVYVHSTDRSGATELLLLLEEPNSMFYGVEMSGNVSRQTLDALSHISPAFFDSYIDRFNVIF